MGILDFFRGKKKKPSKTLPAPTPVATPRLPIPSDIPPIKPVDKVAPVTKPIPDPLKKEEPTPISTPKVVYETKESKPIEHPDVTHVFVSSDEYSIIMDQTTTIRSKLVETDEALHKLAKLRNIEQKELEKWRQQLDQLEKKLNYVDQVIAKSSEV